MYESPIKILHNAMMRDYEEGVVKAVLHYDIQVDKDELLRALQYDRGQYDKGFADGKAAAMDELVREWIPVTERLPQCGERVLITEGNAVFEASLSISHKWVRCGIGWTEGVTHWMPLPDPPCADMRKEKPEA